MIGESILFYTFALTLLGSASCVILARNPVHSVLFLILAFMNGSGLFLLLNAELLAMSLAIVYVGAVAVLFLFVVMMLDVDFTTLRQGAKRHASFSVLIGLILGAELSMVAYLWKPTGHATQTVKVVTQNITNTQMIGSVLYTDYLLPFQVSGLILLVAMIGAITLTLRFKPETRRQDINTQMRRTPADTLTMNTVESGKGVKI
ncbi:MAG: NADH-quinone oxidoreductase subunit J [Candidatus Paracaedibacteraceae bacterium]|nr:NADH-quinone oxidoreductase subunit J [Candidatus Paracaedibacteraceae bacterium]